MSRKIILDTETTGLEHSKGHRITEIGCLEMINRKLTGRQFQSYLNPEREVDPTAADITGLTLEFLKDKPKFIDVVDEFSDFIAGAELIIHNASFDLGFLNSEFSRIKKPWTLLEEKFSIIDTLILARRLHPGQKNNLDALCKRYNVDNTHRQYHGALLDADILAKVYLCMTAGQSNFAFGPELEGANIESQLRDSVPKQHTYVSIKRLGTLAVIRPTAAEQQLHDKIMSEIA